MRHNFKTANLEMTANVAAAIEVAVEVTLADFHAESSKRGSGWGTTALAGQRRRSRGRSSLTKIECDLLKSIGRKHLGENGDDSSAKEEVFCRRGFRLESAARRKRRHSIETDVAYKQNHNEEEKIAGEEQRVSEGLIHHRYSSGIGRRRSTPLIGKKKQLPNERNDDDDKSEEEEERDDVFPEDEMTAIANTAAAFAPSARRGGSVVSSNNSSRLGGRRESAARRNLRHTIGRHRNSITAVEAMFLRDLLEAEDVSDEAMANTAAVLETDVAYKQDLAKAEQHGDEEQKRVGEGLIRRYGGGGSRSSAHSRRSRRKSSILSYETNSARSSIRLSVVAAKDLVDPVFAFDEELEEVVKPEESPARDVAYRKELWRTRQKSTVEDDDESDDESSIDEQHQPAIAAISPPTLIKQSSLVAFFDRFIDFECSQHSSQDTESSICSDDNENDKARNNKSDSGEKKTSNKAEEEDSPVSFLIMGMCPTDENATGLHVLTPPLMDTLRHHMPYAIRDDNFWLKYSLAQDGASIDSLLARVRSSSHTILAIETTEGEVFGSFTSTPWRHKGPSYYGSCESFLWRMRRNRRTPCETVRDRAELESDVEVFKWTGLNRNIQMCSLAKGMLAVGGGEADDVIDKRLTFGAAEENNIGENNGSSSTPPASFGIVLNHDLSSGTTGRCITFGTPASGLSAEGSTGGAFEVSNVEVWTVTPMRDVERAEKLELSRQFVFNSDKAAQASGIQPRRASKMARAA